MLLGRLLIAWKPSRSSIMSPSRFRERLLRREHMLVVLHVLLSSYNAFIQWSMYESSLFHGDKYFDFLSAIRSKIEQQWLLSKSFNALLIRSRENPATLLYQVVQQKSALITFSSRNTPTDSHHTEITEPHSTLESLPIRHGQAHNGNRCDGKLVRTNGRNWV